VRGPREACSGRLLLVKKGGGAELPLPRGSEPVQIRGGPPLVRSERRRREKRAARNSSSGANVFTGRILESEYRGDRIP
jgi:hypothetical protein